MAAAAISRRRTVRIALAAALALPSCGLGLSGLAKAAVTSATWPEWKAFAQAFITDTGRVVDRSSPTSLTYSEGQAYALFFALVANDRSRFEALLRWTEDNLCGGDLTAQLPAWQWGHNAQDQWGPLDNHPASDADLWIAYALGEAGRLWQQRRYSALSRLVMDRVLREEVAHLPGLGPTLLPGPVGFALSGDRWRLSPSYLPMHLMRWLARQRPDTAWPAVADSSLRVILNSATQGFAPDWTIYNASDASFGPDTESSAGLGAHNAIRVYLWTGLLPEGHPDRNALLQTLGLMGRWVAQQGVPPAYTDARDGSAQGAGSSGFSAALLPFLSALKLPQAVQAQQARLEARPLAADAYYDHVLALFGLGSVQGRYRINTLGELEPAWAAR